MKYEVVPGCTQVYVATSDSRLYTYHHEVIDMSSKTLVCKCELKSQADLVCTALNAYKEAK